MDALGRGDCHGIHAQHIAVVINKRAAGIAAVDGSVGLEHVAFTGIFMVQEGADQAVCPGNLCRNIGAAGFVGQQVVGTPGEAQRIDMLLLHCVHIVGPKDGCGTTGGGRGKRHHRQISPVARRYDSDRNRAVDIVEDEIILNLGILETLQFACDILPGYRISNDSIGCLCR